MYDIEYYENLLRIHSVTAEEISQLRWHFLINNIVVQGGKELKKVLDYGSGVGWFRAWRPAGVTVWSYDIGLYPQTGIDLISYDVICFWDVLEHIRDFKDIEAVLRLADHVACTVPIIPDEGLSDWKHFKPGEHLHYFTKESLVALFDKFGFTPLVEDDAECPPRKDVTSFLFARSTKC